MPGTRHHLHVSDTHCPAVPSPTHPEAPGWFLFATWVPLETWKNVSSLSSLVLISITQNLLGTVGGGSRKII